jgi:hypothetical protein
MAETVATSGLTPITILNQDEYFTSLQQNMSRAGTGDRISMTVMGFEPCDLEAQMVVSELHEAAMRRAEITFGVDAYTFMVTDGETYVPGPLFLPLPFGQRIFKQRLAAYNELAAHDTVCAGVLNVPSHKLSNVFAGRSHIKMTAVNDTTYVAGPNLYALKGRDDMILAMQDEGLARYTHAMIRRLVTTGSTARTFEGRNSTVPIDEQTDLLIDAGVPGSSLIMDTALAAIDRAGEHIVLASQFFPTSQVTKRLRAAHDGEVAVRIVRNRPMKEKSLKKLWQLGSLAANRLWLPAEFFADQVAEGAATSHTALLVTEDETLKGGHNYHSGGVRWGTAEAVLHRRGDRQLAQAVARNLLRQVGLSE